MSTADRCPAPRARGRASAPCSGRAAGSCARPARALPGPLPAPTRRGGRTRSSSSSVGSSLPGSYAARNPRNVMTVPDARELDVLAARARRADSQRHRLAARILHLRRERSFPDEVVERELVAAELALELLGCPEACRRRAGSPRAPPGHLRLRGRKAVASPARSPRRRARRPANGRLRLRTRTAWSSPFSCT